jgi:hypothetical protein
LGLATLAFQCLVEVGADVLQPPLEQFVDRVAYFQSLQDVIERGTGG